MKYPGTKFIGIDFNPGSGGNMLASIVASMVWPAKKLKPLDPCGSADNLVSMGDFNIVGKFDEPEFSYSAPIDPTQPVIAVTHEFSPFHQTFNTWPAGKVILITLRPEDVAETSILKLLKTLGAGYHPNDYESVQRIYHQWFPALFPISTTIDTLTPGMIEAMFNDVSRNDFEIAGLEVIAPAYRHGDAGVEVPAKYKSRVLKIPYYYITRRPNVVLEMVSKFVGNPAHRQTAMLYRSWCKKQSKILTKWAPWVRTDAYFNKELE